jgi:DNA-binding response OmpR family regulator
LAEILVVSNDPLMGDVLGEAIWSEGHVVRRVADFLGAMRELDPERPPSLILFHLTAPRGGSFLSWLRSDARFAITKVLVLVEDGAWANDVRPWADEIIPGAPSLLLLLEALGRQLRGP